MERRFQWSRNESELKELTQHEFCGLMESLSIIQTLEILCSWGRIYVLSVGLSEVYNFLMCLYPFYIYCHIMSVYHLNVLRIFLISSTAASSKLFIGSSSKTSLGSSISAWAIPRRCRIPKEYLLTCL